MPFQFAQKHQNRVRRHFSSLSDSPSRAKYCSNFLAQESATSPVPPPAVDENRNHVQQAENGGATNLEVYRQRCRTLEAENARLMANQGRIIADSNRRMDAHLEEIRCLKEQLNAQQRSNAELARWGQTMESECRRAKELAREWQKFGQCSNQLMNRELRSNQQRVDQLETRCGELAAENAELKRLCLYLDEQRQAGWRQLLRNNHNNNNNKDIAKSDKGPPDPASESAAAADCCCPFSSSSSSSEDAGCCPGGPCTPGSPSPANSVNSLENNKNGEGRDEDENDGGRRRREEVDPEETIRVDSAQEQVLRSICSEMHNSMHNDGQHQLQNVEFNQQKFNKRSMNAQMPPGNDGLTVTELAKSSHLSNNYSSSSWTTAQYEENGGSCRSSSASDELLLSNTTTVTVGDRDNNEGGETRLEVRELCTISEEEDNNGNGVIGMEQSTRERLARLEQLGRELRIEKEEEEEPIEELYSTIIVPRGVEEQLYATIGPLEANDDGDPREQLYSRIIRRRERRSPNNLLLPNEPGISICSSMLAEAGSMLTSVVGADDEQRKQSGQMDEEFCTMRGGGMPGAQRNSTGGSSTSSGAFSGTTGENGGEDDDDDLPPQMPLISVAKECAPPSSTAFRCASSIGSIKSAASASTAFPSFNNHRQQSTTLPRGSVSAVPPPPHALRPSSVLLPPCSCPGAPGHVLDSTDFAFARMGSGHGRMLSPRPQRKMSTKIDNEKRCSVLDPSVGGTKSTSSAPVRIRVRPPPSQLQQNPKKPADVTMI